MIKSTNDIRIFGAVLILAIVILLAVSYLASDGIVNYDDYYRVGAYFINPATCKLEREERTILKASNEEMITELLLEILYKGPNNKALANTIPEFVQLRKGELIENKSLLELDFDAGGNSMTGEEELFFKSSLVWTMTELPMITDVHIYIDNREMLNTDGSPVGLLNRNNVIVGQPISPFVSDVYRVLLYFADGAYTGLFAEERVIQVTNSGPDLNIEKYVVEQLIEGPSKPAHFSTMPTDTKVRDVKTEGDICYVNLNSDAWTKLINSEAGIRLTIYSIVNSLTEIEKVKRVQFLIDSKKPESIIDGYDLNRPLERDESMIITEGSA